MLANETSLQSTTPGTKNAKMIAVTAMAADCQPILIPVRIFLFPALRVPVTKGTANFFKRNSTAQAHLSHRINGCLVHTHSGMRCTDLYSPLPEQLMAGRLKFRKRSCEGSRRCHFTLG